MLDMVMRMNCYAKGKKKKVFVRVQEGVRLLAILKSSEETIKKFTI
jgi:hypothetical protein